MLLTHRQSAEALSPQCNVFNMVSLSAIARPFVLTATFGKKCGQPAFVICERLFFLRNHSVCVYLLSLSDSDDPNPWRDPDPCRFLPLCLTP